jgi:eukaryotic-like serine/threonine-protein kinase
MSPEQVRAVGDIDERTDVWAFSVLLYETIAGRRPFEGTSAIGVYAAIVTDEPTPVTDFGAGDDDLWAIIQGGLTKAPAARTPSMRVLGRALARWAQRRGVGADASGVSLTQHWLNEGLSGSNAATPDVIQAPASSPAPAARPFPRWALAAAGVLAVVCVTGAVALTRPNRGQRAELSLSAVASPREARLPAPDEPIQVSRFGDPPEPRAKAAAPVSSQPAHRPPAKKAPHDAPPPHKQPIKAGF